MSCLKRFHDESDKFSKNSSFQKKKIEIPKDETIQMYATIEMQNSFRQSNILCDVILLADNGVKIPAHKVILASGSPVFLSMFSNNFKEKDQKIVSIKEIDSDILENIIEYIYTFKLNITDQNIERLLKAVHFFSLDKVVDSCCDFIEVSINLENCLTFMKQAQMFSYDRLYTLSFSYILENFFNINEDARLELGFEEIQTFISDNCLVTQSEEQVYNFVISWVKFDEENRTSYLLDLMENVRLPLLSSNFYSKVVQEPLLRQHSKSMVLTMESVLFHLAKSDNCEAFKGLAIKGKRRIPMRLNKPDVLIAIDNDFMYQGVSYLDIGNNNSDWQPGSNLLIPPNGCSKIVSLDNGIIFSIGGQSENYTAVNDVFILDLSDLYKRWIKTTPMIFSRKYFAVCIHKNRIYVIGGVGSDEQTLDTIEVYDINTKTWSLLCTMNKARSHCSAVFHNNNLYIVGGQNSKSNPLLLIECFNEPTLTWINHISQLNEWRLCNTSIAVHQDTLYIVGGYGHKYHRELGAMNTVFKCDLKKNNGWSCLTLIKNRQNSNALVINEKIYIVGGNDPIMEPIPLIEIYDPKRGTFELHRSNLTTHALNIISFNSQLMKLVDIQVNQIA